MQPKGFIKCLVCSDRATIIFKSKFSNAKRGYCRRHYGNGKWLERQKLFPEDRWVLEE